MATLPPQPTFTEREPWEKGFAEVFRRQIAPELAKFEAMRLKGKRRIWTRAPATLLVCAGLWVGWFWLDKNYLQETGWYEDFAIWIFIAMVFGMLVFFILFVFGAMISFKDSYKETVVQAAADFFPDLSYLAKVPDDFPILDSAYAAGVLPVYVTSNLEDSFVGQHRGTRFGVVEADLEVRTGSTTNTVFKGLIFVVEAPLEFDGRVLVEPNRSLVAEKLRTTFSKLNKVDLLDTELERRFDAYASAEAPVSELLTPDLFRALEHVSWSFNNAAISLAFSKGEVFIAIPVVRDLFAPGQHGGSVFDCEEDLHVILRDIQSLYWVVDALHGVPIRQAFTEDYPRR